MSRKTDTYNHIMASYEQTREKNKARQKARYSSLCEKFPRIAEIDREINMLGIKSVQATILDPKSAPSIAKNLGEKIAALKAEKDSVIASSGIDEGYLSLEYDCPLCEDTGYIGNERCTCLKNKLLNANYDMSNIKNILEFENFGTFNINYYSEETDEYYGISPRTNALANLDRAMEFCSSFSSGKSLMIFGEPGLGKTFLCNCIAKDILDKGHTVIYTTSWQLFKKLADATFRREDDEDAYNDALDDIISCDLLIIDDLGTELTNSFTVSEFFNIINLRFNSSLSTILSTNLSLEELTEKYSERVTSRIIGSCDILRFFGDDIRLIKKFS
ncbi:MAG: DNA replication protein DnaC [Lachnospiraceae bacterium]|nr:DNA replication protein DnaC [Lachnospiraceae bacterium]